MTVVKLSVVHIILETVFPPVKLHLLNLAYAFLKLPFDGQVFCCTFFFLPCSYHCQSFSSCIFGHCCRVIVVFALADYWIKKSTCTHFDLVYSEHLRIRNLSGLETLQPLVYSSGE